MQSLATKVDAFNPGRRGLVNAFRQVLMAVAAGQGEMPCFQRRGGAAEQHRAAGLLAPVAGHVAGGIAERVLLLERGVVFFIDDDQPEALKRQPHGRTGAHEHARMTVAHALPGIEPGAVGQAGVIHADAVAEALGEARPQLRREADLGHQNQRLTAGLDAGAGGVQVDLGLAAAGDALDELDAAPRRDAVDGLLLGGVEGRPVRVGGHAGGGDIRRQPAFVGQGAGQGVQRQRPAACRQRQSRAACGLAGRQFPQGDGPGFGERPLLRRGPVGRFAAPQRRRQRGSDHLADRVQVIVRRPAQQRQAVAIEQRAGIKALQDRLQIGAIAARRRRGAAQHDANVQPAVEIDLDTAAGGHACVVAHVVERAAQGHRQGNRDDGAGRRWHQSVYRPTGGLWIRLCMVSAADSFRCSPNAALQRSGHVMNKKYPLTTTCSTTETIDVPGRGLTLRGF